MKKEIEPTMIITPEPRPIPKTGHVGYVKVIKKHYEVPELKPRLFDVDLREIQTGAAPL